MQDKAPGFFEFVSVYLGLAAAWLGGESGRVLVAGGAGGLTRWLTSERRRIRDGILGVIVGVLTGQYLWPLGLHLPKLIGGAPFDEVPSNIAMSAFLVGTLGVSMVKVGTAVIEQYGDRRKRKEDLGGE